MAQLSYIRYIVDRLGAGCEESWSRFSLAASPSGRQSSAVIQLQRLTAAENAASSCERRRARQNVEVEFHFATVAESKIDAFFVMSSVSV